MSSEHRHKRLPLLTRHAAIRMQQRAISREALHWLITFGARRRSGDSQVRYFDRRARRRMQELVDPQQLRRLRDRLDCYAVLSSDGAIVTVGHQYRRRRDR